MQLEDLACGAAGGWQLKGLRDAIHFTPAITTRVPQNKLIK